MKKVLLNGSFDGWLNFGDILQLRGVINFYQKKGFKPYILLNRACLQSPIQLELLKNSFTENLVFYDNGRFLDHNLEELSELTIDIFHLYGGGFFNLYWGRTKLEIVERALNYFKPARYFITGQQVSKDFLAYLKKHLKVFKPEVFGVRDLESLSYCKEEGIKAEFSFDDSAEYILEVREKIKKGYESSGLKGEGLSEKKVLFLHLNFSYYTLEKEEDIWAFRERIKPLLKEADEVILVKSFQNYSIEVKDTFRAVDYIFLTHEKPIGRFLDLASFSLRENWEELGSSFPELFSEKALCISNSYHTALFFTFLGVPSFLIKLNPYYQQKGAELWDGRLPEGGFENLSQYRERQMEALCTLLEKRKEFLEKFSALLESAPFEERGEEEKEFTFLEVPSYSEERVECDNWVNFFRNALSWYKEEREKLIEYAKKIEYQASRLWEKTVGLEKELETLMAEREKYRDELEKIYRSRGWKVLSFYYGIKHWLFCKLGLIKNEN